MLVAPSILDNHRRNIVLTRVLACNDILTCDGCGASEIEDIIASNGNAPLREMYALPDGTRVCSVCVALHREALETQGDCGE